MNFQRCNDQNYLLNTKINENHIKSFANTSAKDIEN